MARTGKPVFDRVLGRFGATAVSIGGIIGSGIFFIIGIATAESGPGVLIALALAGIIAMFTALSFASLGSKVVKEGGEYQFIYIAFGPTIGFFAGLLWITATAIAGVTVSLAFASYLMALVPVLPVNVMAAVACIGFMLLDAVGLRFSSKVNNILVIVKLGVLALFIAVALPFVHVSNFSNFFVKGTSGILTSTFLIFFAYAGFGKITAASEEVKNPCKTIPRAIITAVFICMVLYILTGVASVGVVGAERLSSPRFSQAPLAFVMLSTGVSSAFLIVAIGAIAATASVLLIQMLGLSRTIYAMSKNRQFPKFLSDLHPRFRTPFKAEVIIGILMAASALFISTRSIIALTSLGILGYYALVNLAALVMRKKKGCFEVNIAIPILGFASCALLIIYFFTTLLP